MVRRPAIAVLWVLCAGCLSKPERPADDVDATAGDAGSADAAAGDAGSSACDAHRAPAPLAAPFAAGSFVSVQHPVARLDADCRDDLVLIGRNGAGGAHGIFILLGRDQEFLTGYDAFLPIDEDALPLAIQVSDFMGDASVDLLVLARTRAHEGVLLAYPGRGDGTFAAPLTRAAATGFVPTGTLEMPEPVYVLTARVGGAGRGVVFGGLEKAFTLQVDAWDTEGFRTHIPRGLPTRIGSYTQGFARVGSAAAGFDDFMAVRDDHVLWLESENDGVWSGDLEVPFARSGRRLVTFADIDGSGTVDAASMVGNSMQLALTTYPSGTADPRVEVPFFSESPDLVDGSPDALAILDLAGDARPEILILDAAKPEEDSGLFVYRDVRLSGDRAMVVPAMLGHDDRKQLPGMQNRMALGDFDGDGGIDLYPFQAGVAGEAPRCYHVQERPLTGTLCVVLCSQPSC